MLLRKRSNAADSVIVRYQNECGGYRTVISLLEDISMNLSIFIFSLDNILPRVSCIEFICTSLLPYATSVPAAFLHGDHQNVIFIVNILDPKSTT